MRIWPGRIAGSPDTHWVRSGEMTGLAITLCARRPKDTERWDFSRALVTCPQCKKEARRQNLLQDWARPDGSRPPASA